jgi:hypothetical protein
MTEAVVIPASFLLGRLMHTDAQLSIYKEESKNEDKTENSENDRVILVTAIGIGFDARTAPGAEPAPKGAG